MQNPILPVASDGKIKSIHVCKKSCKQFCPRNNMQFSTKNHTSILITIILILRHQPPIPPRRQILLQTPITLWVHITCLDETKLAETHFPHFNKTWRIRYERKGRTYHSRQRNSALLVRILTHAPPQTPLMPPKPENNTPRKSCSA